MNRAGSDYDEETIEGVKTVYDCDAFVASGYDGSFRCGGLRDVVLEEVGGWEGVVASNCSFKSLGIVF